MRRLFALLAAVLGLGFILTPAVAAQEEDSSAAQAAVVHRVDATGSPTIVTVLADNYAVDAGQISIVQDDAEVAVDRVTTANAAGVAQEIVFVVDTRQDLATGDTFNTMKATLARSIRSLPANTSVAIIVAGDTAVIPVGMTANLEEAAAGVEALDLSVNASLYNAIDRAGTVLSDDTALNQTIVVFSGGDDTVSAARPETARTGIIQAGAQVVTVRYQGGDAGLTQIVDQAGGVTLGASNANEASAAIEAATAIASNRLLVEFAGVSETSLRGDVSMTIAGVATEFSYPGGTFTDRPIALQPAVAQEASGIAFFRSSNGLFVAIGLTFVSMGLAVFALGTIFGMGESSLEGLINRYSGDGDGEALNDEESAIVQTALVKRAVEFSESFAEDRGFLVRVEGMLERAKLPLRPGEAMSIYSAIIVFSALIGFVFFGGIFGFAILAALAAFIQIGVVNFLARRRMRKFEQQLPDTLQLLAGTLRAGYSLPQGLEAVSKEISDPMGYELRRVMTEARLGRELEDALASTAERLDSPDFAWAVMAIAIQREVGGNLNELLMTVSDTMIARERLKGEVAALTAEGKLSAMLLGGLPPALGFIMWVMNPEYINQLFVTGLGNILLGLAIVSSLIGFAWMKKVITINV